MKKYLLNPEVSGELGEESIFSKIKEKNGQLKIDFLHLIMEGWMGDDILECTPCFLVSQNLLNSLNRNGITNYITEYAKIEKSDIFIELQPNTNIPTFIRLIPIVDVFTDDNNCYINQIYVSEDICWNQLNELVISEKVLQILMKHKINHCDVTELEVIV